jgi:hypothetical protein
VPADGEQVVVPAGMTVILDSSTAALASLELQGNLAFDPAAPTLLLTAGSVLLNGGQNGRLPAHTRTHPLAPRHRAVLVLCCPSWLCVGGCSLPSHLRCGCRQHLGPADAPSPPPFAAQAATSPSAQTLHPSPAGPPSR